MEHRGLGFVWVTKSHLLASTAWPLPYERRIRDTRSRVPVPFPQSLSGIRLLSVNTWSQLANVTR